MARRVVPGLPVMMVLGNILRGQAQAKRAQAQPAAGTQASAAASTSRAA
jgi:hypothetical protein